MKKRIRKKLHLGEFEQYGNVIIVNTDGEEKTADDILNKLELVIDRYSLTVAGGGSGRLLIPSRKNNKYIPELAAIVVRSIVDEEFPIDQMMFCVYMKGSAQVPQEALDVIKDTFADKEYDVQIGKSVDLWHCKWSPCDD